MNPSDNVAPATSTVDLESGDEPIHDQLPSVEEYRTSMGGASTSPPTASAGAAGLTDANDDDEVVHDQLPSADEIKATSGSSTKARVSWLTVCGVIALFISVALVIIIPIALIKDNDSVISSSENAAGSQTGGAGTSTGGGGTGGGGTTAAAPSPDRKNAIIQYLGDLDVSRRADMMTVGTPQFNAVEWITNQDPMQMEIPTSSQKHSRFAERYALAVLYYSTNGPFWQFSMNFLSGDDHCDWNDTFITSGGALITLGVSDCTLVPPTDETAGGLMAQTVALPLNQLFGELPEELEFLNSMETFVASFNSGLSGEIPNGMRMMTNLVDLELQYCFLRGNVPDWIGEMTSLEALGLGNNRFEGALPQSLFTMTNLQFIGLDDNFVEGNIGSFNRLSNLYDLYLEDNAITGELTVELINSWPVMREMDLSVNNIASTIPANMLSMPELIVLDIHGNQLNGQIPQIFQTNEKLEFLAMFENQLTGQIPNTIFNLPNLAHLDVARNQLSSTLPLTLGQLSSLRYLFAGENPYTSSAVPDFLFGLTSLEELSLKDANLIGAIPSGLGLMTDLILLDLDQNNLAGALPAELSSLTQLSFLLVNRNQLTGTIPESYGTLSTLQVFLFDDNSLSGTANFVCEGKDAAATYFVGDCEGPVSEIQCDCCQLCCNDSNSTCNNYVWTANLDPIWEYGFDREIYQFSTEVTEAAAP